MAKKIMTKLRQGRNIICSEVIKLDKVSKNGKLKIGRFEHRPIEEMNPEYFYRFAYENHVKGKEYQTYIIIDECHRIFNPREWNRNDRKEWLTFFSEHRHLGFDIILVSQNDRQVDRQIRSQFEYEYKHRKVNNMMKLGFLLPTIFLIIERYYGNNEIISKQYMFFRKKTATIYDSYAKFDDFIKKMQWAEKAKTCNKPPANEVNAPQLDPIIITNRVSPEENPEEPIPPAVGAEPGVGGPRRSARRWWQWFTKDIKEASLKS
ncbi:MAG: zonular occludens toxin domain-containing protein [Defluviitaleaceae bacterium]|nr:zonular occludens toxin domain-containing protein [Defluviitaleaceae bacterium]MCL2264362.1 zonular occludens toxin domain-containing protein [Defluviitaleaceae bacterium]